jgi:hypothetical protein
MTNAMATTVSRRGWLSRMLVAAAAAPVVGATLVSGVGAKVNTTKVRTSIRKRVQNNRSDCEAGGGTLTVETRPGGTTTTCTGGDLDGLTCTHSKKTSRCHTTLTNSPATNAGGGGAVRPGGGNEDPTNNSGAANAGGGTAVPPGGGVDSGGGPGSPVLE